MSAMVFAVSLQTILRTTSHSREQRQHVRWSGLCPTRLKRQLCRGSVLAAVC